MVYWLALIVAFVLWMVGWAAAYRYRLSRLADIERHFEASVAARHQNEEQYRWLQRHHHEFRKLVVAAEVQDSNLAYAEVVSPMHVATGQASALDNWLAFRNDTIQWTRRAIEQARGVYQSRVVQSLNPLHWVLMLLTLPMQAVKYIGGNPDGSLSRALTVLWWLAGAVVTVASLLRIGLFGLQ